MTTPNGSPAWVRANDFTTYGGHLSKRNYQDIPIINPKTDVSAEALCRLAADLAAVQRTAFFAALTFSPADPSHPSVTNVRLMTGITSTPYTGNAPPTGYPSVAYQSTGYYIVTFATSYADPFLVSGALDLQVAQASAFKSGVSMSTTVERINAYTWRVRTFTSSTAAATTATTVHAMFQ